MSDFLESLFVYLRGNWPELLWIVAAAGLASYLAARRARWRWENHEFLDRLNVTLSSIEDGKLRIRTILEMDGEQVFLNTTAARTIVKLAKQTTLEDPILPIPTDDCWQYLNAVLNEISERFAAGQIKRDLGMPVVCEQYVLCLTCERAAPVRTQKVRGMLVRKSLLTALPEEEPAYESLSHSVRWATLQHMAVQYQQNRHRFVEMEICV